MTTIIENDFATPIFYKANTENITEETYLGRIFENMVGKTRITNEKIIAILNSCSIFGPEHKRLLIQKNIELSDVVTTTQVVDSTAIKDKISVLVEKILYMKMLYKEINEKKNDHNLEKIQSKILKLSVYLKKTTCFVNQIDVFNNNFKDLEKNITFLEKLKLGIEEAISNASFFERIKLRLVAPFITRSFEKKKAIFINFQVRSEKIKQQFINLQYNLNFLFKDEMTQSFIESLKNQQQNLQNEILKEEKLLYEAMNVILNDTDKLDKKYSLNNSSQG